MIDGDPPDAETRYSDGLPPVSLEKIISEPSGDHVGELSTPGVNVRRLGEPPPESVT
jgi:hypothetical protein